MRKTFTFLIILFLAFGASAQIDYKILFGFEDGVDTTIWNSFANGALSKKSDIEVVLNPLPNNTNGTDSVLVQKVNNDADSWVGYYVDLDTLSIEGLYGAIEFTDESHIMSLMVYKTVSSPVRMKVERSLLATPVYTVADTNVVVFDWELLEFDFSAKIGDFYQRLTIFTDQRNKNERGADVTNVYVDNIGIQKASNTAIKEFEGAKMKLYPNPAAYRMAVVYPGMTGVKISNINGQEIRTLKFGVVNQKVIEVGDLNPGMYLVTALTGKGNFTMQFMKK